MADGQPKNYSNMDQDESPPLPPARFASGANNQKRVHGWSDGNVSRAQHRENSLDLAELSRRLNKLPTSKIAMDSLKVHYSDVFEKRKNPPPPTRIKVIINYVEENETYIFSIPRNNANLVENLAPRKGSYRYFFEHLDGSFEEMMGDTEVPIQQATRSIKCKVFSA